MSWAGLPAAPAELKPMHAFLQRAEEMQDRDAAVAYWCRMHVAQNALRMTREFPAIRPWLLAFVNALEKEKNERQIDSPGIGDLHVGREHLQNFAGGCYEIADRDDSSGKATLRTAKVYLAASNYLDVVAGMFSEGESEVSNALLAKSKYAKSRAAEIVRAHKAGVPPLPPAVPANVGDAGSSLQKVAGLSLSNTRVDQYDRGNEFASQSTISQEHIRNLSDVNGQPHLSNSGSAPQMQVVPGTTAMVKSPDTCEKLSPSSIVPDFMSPLLSGDLRQRTGSAGARAAVVVDSNVAAQATKHARFAISALEYDDIKTALINLRKATALLTRYE